jgi:hypothetical protein
MPQVGDPVPEKSTVLPMVTPHLATHTLSETTASMSPRTRMAWRIAFGILVIVVWLAASLNAPAAVLALITAT